MADDADLLAVYLANGDDALKRERVEERLTKRVSQLGDLSFNSDTFDGAVAKGADIVAACNTLPFASAVRLVAVRNADKLKSADANEVADYLGAPCETTVLALYAAKLSKSSRLYKAVAAFGKSAVIDCTAVRKRDLPALVTGMAKTHGLSMTRGAVGELIDRVGEDTVRLDAELRKLALAHAGADPVNESEVAMTVGRTAELKWWDFVDAFSARNMERCLYCLSRMPSESPYTLISQCIKRIRELIAARAAIARHRESELTALLHLPASQAWKSKNYLKWARCYSDGELRDALRTARDADRKMKSGYDPQSTFENWFLGIVAK